MIDELFENAKQTVGTKTARTSITHYLKSVVYTSCKGYRGRSRFREASREVTESPQQTDLYPFKNSSRE